MIMPSGWGGARRKGRWLPWVRDRERGGWGKRGDIGGGRVIKKKKKNSFNQRTYRRLNSRAERHHSAPHMCVGTEKRFERVENSSRQEIMPDVVVFFFKQKTAYEIKECDWSSDVCSSD